MDREKTVFSELKKTDIGEKKKIVCVKRMPSETDVAQKGINDANDTLKSM